MKRVIALFCLVLLLVLPFAGQAASSDLADVLSASVKQDLDALDKALIKSNDLSLVVTTRHFLGGESLANFLTKQRQGMAEPDKVALVLMVIGEERYQASLGKNWQSVLSNEQMDQLLSSALRPGFVARNYDAAAARLALALSDKVAAQAGQDPAKGLFSAYRQEQAVVARATTKPLDAVITDFFGREGMPDNWFDRNHAAQQRSERSESGWSLFKIAIIGYVLYRLFGRKKRVAQKRGCGPLSYILGTWGVAKFFGWRK